MNEIRNRLLSALCGFILGALIFWIAGMVSVDQRNAEYQKLVAASEERDRSLTSAISDFSERLVGSEGIIISLGSELASSRAEVAELRKQIPRISGKLSDADESLERAASGADSLQGIIDEALRQLEGAISSGEK